MRNDVIHGHTLFSYSVMTTCVEGVHVFSSNDLHISGNNELVAVGYSGTHKVMSHNGVWSGCRNRMWRSPFYYPSQYQEREQNKNVSYECWGTNMDILRFYLILIVHTLYFHDHHHHHYV